MSGNMDTFFDITSSKNGRGTGMDLLELFLSLTEEEKILVLKYLEEKYGI